VSGPTGLVFVVEAATNLAAPSWFAPKTIQITGAVLYQWCVLFHRSYVDKLPSSVLPRPFALGNRERRAVWQGSGPSSQAPHFGGGLSRLCGALHNALCGLQDYVELR
jgi:hypothetical protein